MVEVYLNTSLEISESVIGSNQSKVKLCEEVYSAYNVQMTDFMLSLIIQNCHSTLLFLNNMFIITDCKGRYCFDRHLSFCPQSASWLLGHC